MMKSKWNYFAAGGAAYTALMGAVVHSIMLVFLGVVFTYWNWKVAEMKSKEELENAKKPTTEDEK